MAVEITSREIWDQLQQLTRAVDAQNGQLGRLCDAQKAAGARLERLDGTVSARLGGYAQRLRQVERRVWALPSAAVLLAAVSVAVSAWG